LGEPGLVAVPCPDVIEQIGIPLEKQQRGDAKVNVKDPIKRFLKVEPESGLVSSNESEGNEN
jgi:hypothetical protein